MPVTPAEWLTPERRATIFYFSIFMGAGASTAYGGIWFKDQGLDAGQIGIIGSLPVFIILLINVFVGRVADRASDWRQVITIGAVLSGIITVGLFFSHGFLPILLIWTLATVPANVVNPVLDAATMRMTRRNGTDYGVIRAWGTIGYLVAIVATGFAVQWLGSAAYLPLFVGVALLRGVLAFQLPNFRAPVREQGANVAGRLREVMKPWFLLPLVGWAMVFATHLILNTFQALLWSEQGIPAFTIALLVAVGAAAEASMMWLFKHVATRFPARRLILISAIVSVLRWVAMGFAPDVPVLFAMQLLHSVTFAMAFMGCVNFTANWTSEDIAAEAQSFFQVLQLAMATVAVFAFGYLAQAWHAQAYFASAAFAAIGAVLIFASMRMMQPKPH